ncbi:MAG: hypothetical protein NVSMB12_12440 [Acidimicrobiales bacterium]
MNDAPELDESAQARLIIELSRDVTTHLDLQQVLDSGLAALRRLLDFGGGAIQLIHDGYLVAAATDPPATTEAMSVRIPLGQGVSGTIASTGLPCYIPDITVDRRVYPDGRARGVSGGVRTYFGVPLILHGMPIGVVQFDSPEVDAFGAAERTLVTAFVPTIAAAVQNAQLFEQEAATLNELREVQRMRSDFLAMVSHELRTPLTTVSGMAQTLEGQIDRLPHDVIADFAHKIVLNSRRLELLIDDLLDLSALDRGELVVVCRPLDLGEIVRQSLADTDLGDHPLTCSIATDLPPVLADERRVRQVLGNLLGNARKYSPPGTGISVRVHADGDRVVVEVADRGSGIPAHLLEKIFEPFFQIEPAMTRHVGGLGAGLNLVRRLCDLMGATISVHSASPTGSVFATAFRVEPPDQRRGAR